MTTYAWAMGSVLLVTIVAFLIARIRLVIRARRDKNRIYA